MRQSRMRKKTMISLEVRNETVGTVLEKLKKESGFDFFFNNKHVDLKRIVSVSANNNNIFKILDQIFAGTNVKYSVLEKKIILSTEIVQGIQQEQNKVTGIVKIMRVFPSSVQRLWKKEVQTAQFLILTETLVFK